ncbi:haloacid dehalogenase-like hydrolase, partial [bacterium]|nr:haloacid dehalogenase-like hydrolase [bacterium]
MRSVRILLLLAVCLLLGAPARADELPSWRETPVRSALLAWLADVTREGGPDYIPPAERIAVFDNDGTSACERPHGGSSAFQKDLLRTFVAEGRADGADPVLAAWLADDRDALKAVGWTEAYARMNAAFAGMEMGAYRDSAWAWVARNPHERFGVPVDRLYYAPMIELKDLLEAHGFQVWIVTASTQEYIRAVAPAGFGIAPGRVIGTWTAGEYGVEDGRSVLRRGAEQHNNGYENKPGSI